MTELPDCMTVGDIIILIDSTYCPVQVKGCILQYAEWTTEGCMDVHYHTVAVLILQLATTSSYW